MISLNYAKKVEDGYVMNFYADKAEDITNFDPNKDFMFYGKPVVGSLITLVTGTDTTNYYLNSDGEFVAVGSDANTDGE